ncbi:MAG: AMP-binding protein, partial [Chloroflexi bacterium]|nr:AMP-binding protein [Chloroflexota bacterium]
DLPLRALFEAPTVAGLAAQLAQAGVVATLPLLPVPRDGRVLPLSFAQQRLWFLDQLQPGSPTYHVPLVMRLHGALDRTALERSLSTIIARHEVLRTTFAYDPTDRMPEPYQQIASPDTFDLPCEVLPDALDEAAIRAQVQTLIAQPFDLAHGPLLRATLLQRHADEHILVLVIHHAVFDGWSQSVLLRELSALYRGFTQGDVVDLPALPIQYADYAVWQRQWLSGTVLEQQLGYWCRQLQGIAPLDLPGDYPRPANPSDHGAIVELRIPAALTHALEALSQQLDATLFMTLLAAWQTLLLRYSGQHDIAVGTPIAGRTRPELEGLIGFFVNTLVLRTDLSGQPSFTELVNRTRSTALDAYAHQDVPFEQIVEAVQPERDLSRTPLFQVMFTLQNMPRGGVALPDLRLEPLAVESHSAKFDLSLTLLETPGGLTGNIEYRTDLFAAATIERMADHFQTLLAAVVANPQQRIDRLPLLPAAERRQILHKWPAPLPLPAHTCLHDLVGAQAARTPQVIAVEHDGEQLSYAELDRRANQLAHRLQALGIGPDSRVAVCLPRSIQFVVAMLGVLKAGGAYVPLDPDYPEERRQFMLADSAVQVLITRESLRAALPGYTGAIICVDRDASQIDQLPTTPPTTSVDPDHLMLILYTSGSTGTPKGVLLTHRNIVSYLHAARARYPIQAGDRVLQFASISFDTSIEDFYAPLIIGATIVLRTEETLSSPARFAQL